MTADVNQPLFDSQTSMDVTNKPGAIRNLLDIVHIQYLGFVSCQISDDKAEQVIA